MGGPPEDVEALGLLGRSGSQGGHWNREGSGLGEKVADSVSLTMETSSSVWKHLQ